MATKAGYFQFDDQMVESSGDGLNDSLNDCLQDSLQDSLDDSGSISGWDQPSIAFDRDAPADDSLPLFLTSDIDEPHMPTPEAAWGRSTRVVVPRILKASVLAASAIAIAFGLLSREDKRAVVENASASLVAALPARAGAVGRTPPSTIQIADAGGELPATAAFKPTRAEIATAFQTALHGQTEIRQSPVATPPARHLDADELATLLNRAKSLIGAGDIASARLLLERAADAQQAGAALILAETYDPAVLGTPDARSIAPDPAAARIWYRKAVQLGSQEAQQRLDRMQN